MPRNDTEIDELDQGARKKFAKVLAKRLIRDAGVTAAPVSLERIIGYLQRERNLTVVKEKMPEKISGLMVKVKSLGEESVFIGVNEDEPWCRRRFSLGHELGHLLLEHTGCSGNPNDGSYGEREAQVFSGELLIPSAFIKPDLEKTPNIPALAKLYRVSQQALSIKLKECRLL